MGEVIRKPLILTTQSGGIITVFGEYHTLADIVRWICENRSEAEDILWLLTEQLKKEQGS
jgi:hypothetical protein